MSRQRLVMLPAGAALGVALVILVALLLPARAGKVTKAARPFETGRAKCVRSTVIRVMFFCGQRVLYHNPDGSIVSIGSTKQMSAPHAHLRPVAP